MPSFSQVLSILKALFHEFCTWIKKTSSRSSSLCRRICGRRTTQPMQKECEGKRGCEARSGGAGQMINMPCKAIWVILLSVLQHANEAKSGSER
jgi:hypothetical protein